MEKGRIMFKGLTYWLRRQNLSKINPPLQAKYFIVLDAGHGGADPGALHNGLIEKTLTLEIALAVQEKLLKYGDTKVIMTRTTDVNVPLYTRTDATAGMDAFISIHFNAFMDGSARGLETFAHHAATGDAVYLASVIQDYITSALPESPDRGVRTSNFLVLRNAQCPSALVELGFISNIDEANLIRQAHYKYRIVSALADAIRHYLTTRGQTNEIS